MPSSPDLTQAQRLAHTAKGFAIAAMILLILSIVTDTGLPMARGVLENADDWRKMVNTVGLLLINALPAFLLYASVHSLNGALSAYCDGAFFSREASNRIARSGDTAVEAMVALIIVSPTLSGFVRGERSISLNYESEYLGMLAFAFFVAAVGRILGAAVSLKEENEAFI